MEHTVRAMSEDNLHSSHVDHTLKELQRMVREHENALNLLRASPTPSPPKDAAQSQKASLDVMTNAYQAVAESRPLFPTNGSVLPALLALRKTHRTVIESREYGEEQDSAMEKSKRQLETEKGNLEDQRVLQAALERRIQTLRAGLESSEKRTPQQVAAERLEELRKEKRNYETETKTLLKSLNKFIDGYLGAMLAAEELGGPVVGNLMDVDVDELGAGFNAQGKAKKSKASADEDVRQQRIDQLWENLDAQQPQKGKGKGKRDRDEATAAGAELRDLTEQLLNSLMGSAGDTSASYVRIPRETAAARFLVRSKVAQFHPRDATKLRLVDFGRELDD